MPSCHVVLKILQKITVGLITLCNILLAAISQYEEQTNSNLKGASIAVNVICSFLVLFYMRGKEIIEFFDEKFAEQTIMLSARSHIQEVRTSTGTETELAREPVVEEEEEDYKPVKIFVNRTGELIYAPITPRK